MLCKHTPPRLADPRAFHITLDLFAERFIGDQDAGAPEFLKLRKEGEDHPIESTGRELRKLFAWNSSDDDDYVDGEVAR